MFNLKTEIMKPIDFLFNGLGNNVVSDQTDSHHSVAKASILKAAYNRRTTMYLISNA